MILHNITAEDKTKLNLTYLKPLERELVEECGMCEMVLVRALYTSTIENTSKLSHTELQALSEDIRVLKTLGYWNAENEEPALKWCKGSSEHTALYNRLNDKDKEQYNSIREQELKEMGVI